MEKGKACSPAESPPDSTPNRAEALASRKRCRREHASASRLNSKTKKPRHKIEAELPSCDLLASDLEHLADPASPTVSPVSFEQDSLDSPKALSQKPSRADARPTRKAFRKLLTMLDAVLPAGFRCKPLPNGAGTRSLGIAGRSVHEVLADVVRAVAARRAELDLKKLLQSRGALSVEVEMPGWIITGTSPGAELFFQHAPPEWGALHGQSLADLLYCDNVVGDGKFETHMKLMYFSAPDVQTSQSPISPPLEDHCGSCDDPFTRLSLASAPGDAFGANVFDDDPLLQCDLQDTAPSTTAEGLSCRFVGAAVHVLNLSSSSDTKALRRALVCIRLIIN